MGIHIKILPNYFRCATHFYMSRDAHSDWEQCCRRQSEDSGQPPLFCDDAETKRIIDEHQYYPDQSTAKERSRDTSKQQPLRTHPSKGKKSSPKSTSASNSPSNRQQKIKGNKTYDLRYEYTRKGASVPSTTQQHLDKFNKPPFKRVWRRLQCFEHISDRLQKRLKSAMKRRKSTTTARSTDSDTRRSASRTSSARPRYASGSTTRISGPRYKSRTSSATRTSTPRQKASKTTATHKKRASSIGSGSGGTQLWVRYDEDTNRLVSI